MDDGIDDILDSIFQVIELRDPKLKEKLRRGLERGIEVATELGHDVKVEFDVDTDTDIEVEPGLSPDVVVLDGGRESESDVTDSEPPDLEVIDGDGAETGTTTETDMHVQVLRSSYVHEDPRGRIDVAESSQTVFRGAMPARYRIHCEGGSLRVVLDGLAVDEVIGGQSVDVEAALIQVRGDAEGWYVAVHG